MKNNVVAINERRQKLWTLLTKGLKTHEIAKELNIDQSTISRDIKHLAAQSQSYLNSLAKETINDNLPKVIICFRGSSY
jgi:IS30 family transposase